MNPGTTVIRCASTMGVRAVVRLRTSADEPTAVKRPFLTAKASARGSAVSLVRTRALTTTRSGSPAGAGDAGCAAAARTAPSGNRPSVKAPASAAPNPRNSPRVYLAITRVPPDYLRTSRSASISESLALLPERARCAPPRACHHAVDERLIGLLNPPAVVSHRQAMPGIYTGFV